MSGREDLPSSLVMVGRLVSANSNAVQIAAWMAESYHLNESGNHEISCVNSGSNADSAGVLNSSSPGNKGDN